MWDSDEDTGWAATSMNQLAAAYAPEDFFYEELIDVTPTR